MDKKTVTFGILIAGTTLLAFMVKGIVLGGMFMGLMATIAIWVLVLKMPDVIQRFMGNHPLMSDLALSAGSAAVMAGIGPGPTLFMATITQMVLLSILLTTLKD